MIVIQLLNRLATYPKDNPIYLDVDERTELRQNTSVQELTDINNIKVSHIIGTTIMHTEKNALLLLLIPKNTRIPCRVFEEGEKPVSELFWTSYDEDSIEINFVTFHRTWAEEIQKLKLTALNLYRWGQLTLDRPSIENNWQNGYRWADETPPVYLAPVRYNMLQAGQYGIKDKVFEVFTNLDSVIVTPSDLRPLISPLYILKEMFAKIGWEFASPFYESNYGRELWSYLLSDKFGEGGGYFYKFRCSLEKQNLIDEPIPIQASWVYINDSGTINTTNYDNGSSWILDDFPQPNGFPNASGHWRNQLRSAVRYNFKAVFRGVRHSNTTEKIPIKLSIQLFDEASGIPANWGSERLFDESFLEPVIDPNTSMDVEVVWENVIVPPRYRMRVVAHHTHETLNPSVFVNYGTYIEGYLTDPCLYYKDDVRVKLREDNCLDVLKGFAHAIKGVFLTDWVNKKVTLHAPKNVVLPSGEQIEGYYLPIVQEVPSYNAKIIKNEKAYKDTRIGFKKSQTINAKDTDGIMVYEGQLNPYVTDTQDVEYINPYFCGVEDGVLGRNYNSLTGATIIVSEYVEESFNGQLFDVTPFIVKATKPSEFLIRRPLNRRIEFFYDFNELDFLSLENTQKFVLGTDFREAIGAVYTKIPMVSQNPMAFRLKKEYNADFFTFLGKAKSLAYIFYAPTLKAENTYEVLTPFIDASKVFSENFYRYPIKTQIDGLPKILRGIDIVDYQSNLPVILRMIDYFNDTPDYSDSYYIKRVFKQPPSPQGTFISNLFLGSLKINGEEKIDFPIEIYGIPIIKTVSGVDYIDNWIELLNSFIPTAFYYKNALENRLITMTFPKETEFNALILQGTDLTNYNKHLARFTNEAVWNNTNFDGTDNYAHWEKEVDYDLVPDVIFKEVKL